MREEIAERLLDLNCEFYQRFASEFAASRARLQPGVLRAIECVPADARVLDLGCGHGQLANGLVQKDHRGEYLGLDGSEHLLQLARASCRHPAAHFVAADLATPGWNRPLQPPYDIVTAFAVLHHIPGSERRGRVLGRIGKLLADDGIYLHSNWNFLESPRLRKRIVPWDQVGMAVADVEPGDYLLDWRRGGYGLRYVHLFDEAQLAESAAAGGFQVRDTYYSDGEGGRLGLYQVWTKAGSNTRAYVSL